MATSLYCTTQLHSKTFRGQIFPGACVTRKTLTCHKPTRKSSLLPPVAVAASTSSVQAELRTTAATPVKVLPFRVGHGFDLHGLDPGYPLIIGTLNIPHDRGCEAHSDDIGQIFPDTDPNWKGAVSSSVFVEEAVRLMHEAGYELGNLDASSILQRPKVSPHKEAVRANLRHLLRSDPSVVKLKAKTTHKKVDSLGKNRSIGFHTVVLRMRK